MKTAGHAAQAKPSSSIFAKPAPNKGLVNASYHRIILLPRMKARSISLLVLAAVVALAFIGPLITAKLHNVIPPDAAQALQTATKGTLYSLKISAAPGPISEKAFHNCDVLGQTELNEKQLATATEAFQSAVASWNPTGGIAACFNPRHGLRVTANGHTYDFVLCYECKQLYIYEDDKNMASLQVGGTPDVLNGLLSAANVPLSP
jgi:hypothetical protein